MAMSMKQGPPRSQTSLQAQPLQQGVGVEFLQTPQKDFVVKNIPQGFPAWRTGGLQVGDILQAVNDTHLGSRAPPELRTFTALRALLVGNAGSDVTLHMQRPIRDGVAEHLSVTIVRGGGDVAAQSPASPTVSSPVTTVTAAVTTVSAGVEGARNLNDVAALEGAGDDGIWRCDYCTMVFGDFEEANKHETYFCELAPSRQAPPAEFEKPTPVGLVKTGLGMMFAAGHLTHALQRVRSVHNATRTLSSGASPLDHHHADQDRTAPLQGRDHEDNSGPLRDQGSPQEAIRLGRAEGGGEGYEPQELGTGPPREDAGESRHALQSQHSLQSHESLQSQHSLQSHQSLQSQEWVDARAGGGGARRGETRRGGGVQEEEEEEDGSGEEEEEDDEEAMADIWQHLAWQKCQRAFTAWGRMIVFSVESSAKSEASSEEASSEPDSQMMEEVVVSARRVRVVCAILKGFNAIRVHSILSKDSKRAREMSKARDASSPPEKTELRVNHDGLAPTDRITQVEGAFGELARDISLLPNRCGFCTLVLPSQVANLAHAARCFYNPDVVTDEWVERWGCAFCTEVFEVHQEAFVHEDRCVFRPANAVRGLGA